MGYKIGLIGGGFHHAFSSTLNKKPISFTFEKGVELDITFFVDDGILQGINSSSRIKIGWLLESRDFIPSNVKDFVLNNVEWVSSKFDFIFTHDADFYGLANNFIFIPSHGYWIETPTLYPKNKLISLISSNKMMNDGHKYRMSLIDKFRGKVDLYGRGFRYVEKKEQALCDYMFSIVIENSSYSSYWSEKILDCFATGTIPIYLGSPDIDKWFNPDGIIFLDDKFDFNILSAELYNKKIDAVIENLERVKQYDVIEDIIFEKYLKEKI